MFQKAIGYFMHSMEKNVDLHFKFHLVCFVTMMNACLKYITDKAKYDQVQKRNGKTSKKANLPL